MGKTIILFILLFINNTAGAQLSDNTFKKSIYVPASEVRMDSLLRIFTKQTGVEFSFNSKKISPSKKVTVSQHKQTLSQWLTTLSNSLGIQHKIVGNHIILIDNDKAVSGKINSSVSTTGRTGIVKNNPVAPRTKNETNQDPKVQDANKTLISEQTQNGRVDTFRQAVERMLENSSAAVVVMKESNSASTIQPPPPTISLAAGNVAGNSGPKKRAVQFSGGFCKLRHRSGDSMEVRVMNGLTFGGEYTQYSSRKVSVTYKFRATINNAEDSYHYGSGTVAEDATIRFTTAGFQIGITGGFSFVNSARHEFRINLGPFVRYQSTSNATAYSTYYPPSTGVQAILFRLYNESPQETISVGGIAMLQYNYTFKSNLFIGVQTGYQANTNGNAIWHVGGLVIGKRF